MDGVGRALRARRMGCPQIAQMDADVKVLDFQHDLRDERYRLFGVCNGGSKNRLKRAGYVPTMDDAEVVPSLRRMPLRFYRL